MPVQARSAASVDALLEATLQVLVAVGKERLTTTRVAERAGVSIGTLYQYFPNKSSLLQATLRRHFEAVEAAVAGACEAQRGGTLAGMGAALADSFLTAKMADGRYSVALYAVSSDVDGIEIAQELKRRTHAAICAMLETASDGPVRHVSLVTAMLQGMMGGVSRHLLESDSPETVFPSLHRELQSAVTAYLATCTRKPQT